MKMARVGCSPGIAESEAESEVVGLGRRESVRRERCLESVLFLLNEERVQECVCRPVKSTYNIISSYISET